MCGLAGFAPSDPQQPVSRELPARMAETLRHRGPDGEGVHVAAGIGLGFRRLSIIDLATGEQPIASEDGSVVLVANGEIYNFAPLRAELESAGHRFRTRSDVEVILHLYEEHGDACVTRLRGMFAFALWDARRRRLLLARDRFGIKPLVYAETAEGLFFASEAKALLASGRVERRLDVHALGELLQLGFVCAPRTLLASVRQLEPAHTLVWERGRLETRRYWDLRFPPAHTPGPRGGEREWAEALRAKLDETVRLHLQSDVPVGAWLSAGLDSSTIACLAQRATGRPLPTFSLGFEHARSDELRGQRILSDFPAFGLVDHRAVCTSADFARMRQAVWHAEDPQAVGLEIPRLVLSELAARHVKVVLCGEGADEMFGGYPWFRTQKLAGPLLRLPRAVRAQLARWPALRRRSPRAARILAAEGAPGLARYRQSIDTPNFAFEPGILAPDLRHALAGSEEAPLALPEEIASWHPFSQLQYLEVRIRLPNFVTRLLDSLSMAYGLEARVPFLDHELAELCAEIPPGLKMRGLCEKYVLRRALERDLPAEIAWRPKRGLSAPAGAWLREPPAFAVELLSREAIRARGLFEPEVVSRLVAEHRSRSADHAKSLAGVLAMQLWHDLFLHPVEGAAP